MTIVTKVITCFSKGAERAQRGRREGVERADVCRYSQPTRGREAPKGPTDGQNIAVIGI